MTTASLTPAALRGCTVTPTASDRALLWMSKAFASFAVARMERRLRSTTAAAAAADEARRTALALGGAGILPR